MLVQAVPVFQDAHILRRSMLEALSDYAFLTNQYLYKGYADGILAGCGLTTTKDAAILNEGVVLFEGQLFLVKEPMAVNYHPTNVLNVLRLKFSDVMRDANFIYREVDMQLSDSVEEKKGEMELCRFTLQEGAELRCRYRDFEDRNTDYDTLNQVHAPYAAYGGSTLAPDIVRNFAEEMLDISGLYADPAAGEPPSSEGSPWGIYKEKGKTCGGFQPGDLSGPGGNPAGAEGDAGGKAGGKKEEVEGYS